MGAIFLADTLITVATSVPPKLPPAGCLRQKPRGSDWEISRHSPGSKGVGREAAISYQEAENAFQEGDTTAILWCHL